MSCLLLASTLAPASNTWLGPEVFGAFCLFKMALLFSFSFLVFLSIAFEQPCSALPQGYWTKSPEDFTRSPFHSRAAEGGWAAAHPKSQLQGAKPTHSHELLPEMFLHDSERAVLTATLLSITPRCCSHDGVFALERGFQI